MFNYQFYNCEDNTLNKTRKFSLIGEKNKIRSINYKIENSNRLDRGAFVVAHMGLLKGGYNFKFLNIENESNLFILNNWFE